MNLYKKIRKHKLLTAVIAVCALIILSIPFVRPIGIFFFFLLAIVANIYFLIVLFGVFVVLSIVKCNRLKSENGDVRLASRFVKRHKIITSFLVVLSLILVICITLSPFAAINIPNSRDAHSIGSITWDKWQMNRVDNIVLVTSAGTTKIEDIALINDIVRETMVAQATGFNAIYGEVILYLHRGDNLVRRMELCALHSHMRVYWPSTRHWFFGIPDEWEQPLRYSPHGGGISFIPRELADTIWQIAREISADTE